MGREISQMERLAKRAYELGRLRFAGRIGWLVVPMAIVSALACGKPLTACLVGIALFTLAAALLFRGEQYGYAAKVGILAASAPFLLPLLAHRMVGPICCRNGICQPLCMTACVLGGLTAGFVLIRFARHLKSGRGLFIVMAGLVTAVAGTMGCVVAGLSGVLGMLAGLSVGSLPIMFTSASQ